LGLVLHACGYGYLYWLRRFRYTHRLKPTFYYPPDNLPFQLVQLPVYNEDPKMVKRLVTSACFLKYPGNRLLVQLLDDSDVPAIASELRRWVARFKADHPDIDLNYLHRKDRRDFKAGNLNAGLTHAKKILAQRGGVKPSQVIISIFDADFFIPSDYLYQTVHYFSSPDVGAVQAELGYTDQDVNLFTHAQALFLTNLHWIEFSTRSHSGHLTTYRGSAGSWRLSAVESAGGWKGDTQVEDVDMSFAAQLNGWRILFLDQFQVACQLPHHIAAFKLQQRSWMKGLMEVLRKWAGPIIRATRLTAWQKIMAFDLLLILSLQPLFVILGHLTIIPTWYFLKSYGYTLWLGRLTLGLLILFFFTHFPMLMGSSVKTLKSMYKKNKGALKPIQRQMVALGLIPSLFPTLTYGLLEGLLGVKVHRDRTLKSTDPCYNAGNRINPDQKKILLRILIFEIAMTIYSLAFIVWAAMVSEWLVGGILSCFAIFYPLSAVMTIRTI
jgi:cellulose synthase/poly-beta-1,6-N-acetylglucosamine synthase-like glycosyltransferase